MFPVHPAVTIGELLAAIRRGGEMAGDSALALGLLLEDRDPEHDTQLASVIGGDLAARRLSRSERRSAVDGLITYLQDTPEPQPSAVWALSKSYEPRIMPVLISLLDATLDDQDAVPLAYQALVGIENVMSSTPKYRAQGRAALQRAATRGHGEVADLAQDYLAIES